MTHPESLRPEHIGLSLEGPDDERTPLTKDMYIARLRNEYDALIDRISEADAGSPATEDEKRWVLELMIEEDILSTVLQEDDIIDDTFLETLFDLQADTLVETEQTSDDTTAEIEGVHCTKVELIDGLVLTPDDMDVEANRSQGDASREQLIEPRTQYLEALLREKQLDWHIIQPNTAVEHVADTLEFTYRKHPYYIYVIPSMNKAVFVCDVSQNATYVVHNVPEEATYDDFVPQDKNKLKKSALRSDDRLYHLPVSPRIDFPRGTEPTAWMMAVWTELTRDAAEVLQIQQAVFDKTTSSRIDAQDIIPETIPSPERIGITYDELKSRLRALSITTLDTYRKTYTAHKLPAVVTIQRWKREGKHGFGAMTTEGGWEALFGTPLELDSQNDHPDRIGEVLLAHTENFVTFFKAIEHISLSGNTPQREKLPFELPGYQTIDTYLLHLRFCKYIDTLLEPYHIDRSKKLKRVSPAEGRLFASTLYELLPKDADGNVADELDETAVTELIDTALQILYKEISKERVNIQTILDNPKLVDQLLEALSHVSKYNDEILIEGYRPTNPNKLVYIFRYEYVRKHEDKGKEKKAKKYQIGPVIETAIKILSLVKEGRTDEIQSILSTD